MYLQQLNRNILLQVLIILSQFIEWLLADFVRKCFAMGAIMSFKMYLVRIYSDKDFFSFYETSAEGKSDYLCRVL